MRTPHFLRLILTVFVGLGLSGSGCGSARVRDAEADRLFEEGRYLEAAEHVRVAGEAHGDGPDQLLFTLDRALALHAAGSLDASSAEFLKAEKVAEIKDYSNLAADTAAFMTSDNVLQYRGEEYENLLVNVYLALNFATLGKKDDAVVEARKVDRKIHLLNTEGKRKTDDIAFLHALVGILMESDREFDNAYISYKRVHEIWPAFPYLRQALMRLAILTGDREGQARWKSEYGLTDPDLQEIRETLPRSGKAELTVIFQVGQAPEKKPNPEFRTLPKLFPRESRIRAGVVEVDGAVRATTQTAFDVERAALLNLSQKYDAMVAKKIAAGVTKYAVVQGIAGGCKEERVDAWGRRYCERDTGRSLLAVAAAIFFAVSDEADLRSWGWLPREFQIARIWVAPGKHKVRVLPEAASGQPVFAGVDFEVDLKPGERRILNARIAR